MRYSTLKEMVAALQRGDAAAWTESVRLCRSPVQRLIENVVRRNQLDHDANLLTERLLCSLRMYLRASNPTRFAGQGWPAFVAQLLWVARRMLDDPQAAQEKRARETDCEWSGYQIRNLFRLSSFKLEPEELT